MPNVDLFDVGSKTNNSAFIVWRHVMKYCVPKRWDKVLHDQRGTKFPRQDHLQKTAKFQTSTGDQNNNARAWSPSAVGQLDGQLGQAIFISLIFLLRELLRVDMFVSLGKGMMTSSQSPKPSAVISGQDSPGPAFSVIGFVCLCGFKWKYQQKLHTSASLHASPKCGVATL